MPYKPEADPEDEDEVLASVCLFVIFVSFEIIQRWFLAAKNQTWVFLPPGEESKAKKRDELGTS